MHKRYQGKRVAPGFRKGLVALMALVLVLGVTASGTLAWLSKGTQPVVNTFTMGNVVPEIEETFDDVTKTDVYVTNNGNVPAFVRVKLLFSWQEEVADGVYEIVGVPVKESDISYEWGTDSYWQKGSDGYYYYTQPVNGEDRTGNLLESVTVNSDSESGGLYHLSLNILVDAVQAAPDQAAHDTWGVTVSNGAITGLGEITGSPLN